MIPLVHNVEMVHFRVKILFYSMLFLVIDPQMSWPVRLMRNGTYAMINEKRNSCTIKPFIFKVSSSRGRSLCDYLTKLLLHENFQGNNGTFFKVRKLPLMQFCNAIKTIRNGKNNKSRLNKSLKLPNWIFIKSCRCISLKNCFKYTCV